MIYERNNFTPTATFLGKSYLIIKIPKNPVTGEEQDTKIQLPNGFVWKLAEAAKSKTMHITTPNLNFDHTGKNALYSVVEYKGP